jgi:cellulose synthase/poly-beta-1,6-N-acetylglucosamine synthase-like glycosyltransferase
MPDAFSKPASIAVIPCYNEGRNPIDLAAALLAVPDLSMVFVDDGSEGESRDVLDSLSQSDPRVRVVRNAARAGKVASLLNAMRSLEPSVERVLLVDCDVVAVPATLRMVLDELGRADLVLANALAMPNPRSLWERGAIFSARRHERLRARAIARYPALCSNGRLLGMRRRLVEAILRSDVPQHTEDAHFMLVCLAEGFTYSYRDAATLSYRAPNTLQDFLRQSSRFSEGRALLQARWSPAVLARYYDPKPSDLLLTALAQSLRDPAGGAVFAAMLFVKIFSRGRRPAQAAAWAVSDSTKALR